MGGTVIEISGVVMEIGGGEGFFAAFFILLSKYAAILQIFINASERSRIDLSETILIWLKISFLDL